MRSPAADVGEKLTKLEVPELQARYRDIVGREVWKRQGLHSRMDLFRRSLQAFLASAGETDVAAMLATEA